MSKAFKILTVSFAIIAMSACSKGPSSGVIKELLSSEQLYSYKNQDAVFELDDYSIHESAYSGKKTELGLMESSVSKLKVSLKAKFDCQINPSFEKNKVAIPFCLALSETQKQKEQAILNIKKMKSECAMWVCAPVSEKRRNELLAENERAFAVEPSRIWKAGDKKSFEIQIEFFKDATKVPEKWEIVGRSNLDPK